MDKKWMDERLSPAEYGKFRDSLLKEGVDQVGGDMGSDSAYLGVRDGKLGSSLIGGMNVREGQSEYGGHYYSALNKQYEGYGGTRQHALMEAQAILNKFKENAPTQAGARLGATWGAVSPETRERLGERPQEGRYGMMDYLKQLFGGE